jgi:hypothetical protein
MAVIRTRARYGRTNILAAIGALALVLGACSGLLPKRAEIAVSRFANFDDAYGGYERVTVGATRAKDLAALGFDYQSTANVRQLTYLDVLAVFIPESGVPLSSLPQTIQHCIAAQTRCVGYALTPRTVHHDRDGDAFLDFFDFRRRTRITGWEADALFVLVDDIVVYKLWSGTPRIDKTELTVNPLGPIQDLGSVLNQVIPSINY